ncbi:hypothetical protein [Micromonospora sp. NRRL B-16802]|uniref:hypothetical protein n=1 Tax=Micromonospora sp. NRRL B-16802 TaxID=1415541 RepID=UPI0012F8C589|nr:hypothetical protein [Micromonospora sp. NRRL B-16802]
MPAASTDPDEYGPRVWQDTVYGRARRFYLRPDEHTMPLLARRIADKWLEICPEIHGSVGEVHGAVRGFLRDLDAQLRDTGRDNDFDLPDLRRRHLDSWEAGLLAAQRESRTDTSYRRAVFLFALLRRINDDCPGLLHGEVVARLERETRLSHVRRDGEVELPAGEADRIHAIARGVVRQALAERRGSDARSAPAADVVIALHVLLSLGTGEPPEVLRRLTIGDIIATAVPGRDDGLQCLAPTGRLAALVQRRAVRSYCVRYLKTRSSERYQQVYTRADGRVFAALSALITLTAGARETSDSSSLWLTDDGGVAVEMFWATKSRTLRAWLNRHRAEGDAFSEPVSFRRLRKTATTREALAAPGTYLRSRRRHTARTFFEHYSNSTVLRAEAGRILMQAVGERFDTAVAGPTIVTPAAEELLAAGHDAPTLDRDTAGRLLTGRLDTGVAACRDPHDSPHVAGGGLCPVSTTGACYTCPNALITRQHLPAVLRLKQLTAPERTGNITFWQEHHKPVHEFVTQVILPSFPAADVAAAQEHTGEVLLDVGLVNGLGGADVPA